MAQPPSYADYLSLGGSLPEARFSAALPAALREVDSAIWPNIVSDDNLVAYHRAVCAVADLIDSPPVAEERVGATSVKYAGAAFATQWGMPSIASTIRSSLTGTNLLYRGL